MRKLQNKTPPLAAQFCRMSRGEAVYLALSNTIIILTLLPHSLRLSCDLPKLMRFIHRYDLEQILNKQTDIHLRKKNNSHSRNTWGQSDKRLETPQSNSCHTKRHCTIPLLKLVWMFCGRSGLH